MANPSIQQTLDTSTVLITHLQETLRDVSSSPPTNGDKSINPLALSSTAATLIKAQTTKLTLLAFNKPFSPSTIVQILNTISTSPLPALVTAVQICDAAKFSHFAQQELKKNVSRLLKSYQDLLVKIPASEAAQENGILASGAASTGQSSDMSQKAALIGTGLVWEVCDEIVNFSEQGLANMAGKKMASYRALFNDALEELDEWLEQGPTGDDLQEQLDNLTLEDGSSDSGSMSSFTSRPTKEIIPIADWSLKILNHFTLLYPPSIKRRVRKFPDFSGKTSMGSIPIEHVAKLDQMLEAGRSWSEQVDMIAEALFENDKETAVDQVDELIQSSVPYIDISRLAWDESEDELTTWMVQWSKKLSDLEIQKPPPR